ncbi:conserved hypothetical protein [Verticillium alfalfae VaMs.102]|uniref:CorA-like transporter domain-containing protein n=1 Tax=Verticillium alfalfae (strain VaMs.102 / ATCC MYA-4576 / FGSC 10136) TaxID=526221 RepID=C9SA07_VERA1|nr:conserved hypothetical protein [Verticillium alfalfae VaMs.102]EEY16220.1 conserved hypothetical protein [Verticillium alfalfae VaMs.102]
MESGLWALRPTSAFHSFDLETGRSFWFTIKADKTIRERIIDGAKTFDALHPTNLADVEGGFKSSLATHLLHLEWCTEGWRWYVDEKEAGIEKILRRVKSAPVEQSRRTELTNHQVAVFSDEAAPIPGKPLVRTSTLSRVGSKITHTLRQVSWAPNDPGDEGTHPKLRRGNTRVEVKQAIEEHEALAQSLEKMNEVMRLFSLSELQRLTSSVFELQEAKLAMTLNIEVMNGLKETYECLLSSTDCPEVIILECGRNISDFKRRITGLQRMMTVECLRVDTLIDHLSEAKNLFRNTEINRQNAINARISALRVETVTDDMHDIAKKTERDTSSMHVITFFTLVFLPGTFLGHANI